MKEKIIVVLRRLLLPGGTEMLPKFICFGLSGYAQNSDSGFCESKFVTWDMPKKILFKF